MASDSDRLAQVFIWKQAGPPDAAYARQILSVVNPAALSALSREDPPVAYFSIDGPWPTDPWVRALPDMSATPNPEGSAWADTTRYDLAGWQGTDTRTGHRLFIVTAYRKANTPTQGAFQVEPVPAPSPAPALVPHTPVPQVPYYPQRPTGPISWPPAEEREEIAAPLAAAGGSETTAAPAQTPPITSADETPAASAPRTAWTEGRNSATSGQHQPGPQIAPVEGRGSRSTGVPPIYSRALGEVPAVQAPDLLPDSYAPYYVGLGPRLLAGLADFFLTGLLIALAVYIYTLFVPIEPATDFGSWVARYAPIGAIALLVFALYHTLQWTLWGRSVGKYLLNMGVTASDGRKPGAWRSIARMLGYFFSFSIGGVGGFLMIVFDPRRQALHDKIAETYVVPDAPGAPVPRGLPGYVSAPGVRQRTGAQGSVASSPTSITTQPMAAATVAGSQGYEPVHLAPALTGPLGGEVAGEFRGLYGDTHGLQTLTVLPELPDDGDTTSGLTTGRLEPPTSPVPSPGVQSMLRSGNRSYVVERARELYRQGLEQLSSGVQPSLRGYKVEPASARLAALAFKGAVELVPNSVLYRYFYGVALRYSEGFELAIGEFRRVLELDPSHYEARQQIAYGPRWHDAFAYTPWGSPAPVEPTGDLPEALLALLPTSREPVTRMAILREGTSKVVAVLSKTPRSNWARPLTPDLPAHIDMMLSRTPHGPIIAFYLVVEDKPGDPYKGETFLNPHDPGYPAYDACQLGQNLVSQLARQDHFYLIFVDENNKLLLSRRLDFDSRTQVKITNCQYEIQSLPPQIMDGARFQQAAQWHMQNFSLDQVD